MTEFLLGFLLGSVLGPFIIVGGFFLCVGYLAWANHNGC
jgi:hypothetical protein